jgi:hypothetical protein
VWTRQRPYDIRGSESDLLVVGGTFRVVFERDLTDPDSSDSARLSEELRHLERHGLVLRRRRRASLKNLTSSHARCSSIRTRNRRSRRRASLRFNYRECKSALKVRELGTWHELAAQPGSREGQDCGHNAGTTGNANHVRLGIAIERRKAP